MARLSTTRSLKLVRRGLLIRSNLDGEAAFEPAERGWSAAPDQAQGMKR